jgi:phospholipase/carboxylesterase
MEEATDQVVQMIQAMQDELGVRNERLIVGGFSQGSMAACNAVLTRDLSPAALVILSGTPVNLDAWKAGMASHVGLPVFQSHGQQDALLSFQAAEELNKEMRDAGLATQWVPFRGGHELPMPVLEGLSRFLSDLEPPT